MPFSERLPALARSSPFRYDLFHSHYRVARISRRGFRFATLFGTSGVISVIRKLLGVGAASAGKVLLPEGLRIYAVGDVHGRVDLLRRILEKIEEDAVQRPTREVFEVFLGDYVDRGPNSRDVIETLMNTPAVGGLRHCLRGNHEQILLDFLAEPGVLLDWRRLGGFETLLSYGVAPRMALQLEDAAQLRDEF